MFMSVNMYMCVYKQGIRDSQKVVCVYVCVCFMYINVALYEMIFNYYSASICI